MYKYPYLLFTGNFYMMSTFGGKEHVVYKKYVYCHKKNVPESNISYWDCFKTKCKAKLMLKLTEKQVVGELKQHDHGPPTKVFEKSVWKNIGNKNITKATTSARAINKNDRKTTEEAAHTKKVLTTKVKTMEVQSTSVRKTVLHTVEVQTEGTKTVEVELQTKIVETKETEVQTTAVKVTDLPTMAQNSDVQPEVMTLGIDYNMFTEVAPTDTATLQLLENIPTESAALELPIATVLAGNQSVYFESPNGIQITGSPTEVLPPENIQVTKKNKCSKHHQYISCKRCHCKRDCCNNTQRPINIDSSPFCAPASLPWTFGQPSNVAQTPKYVNYVCVQTDHGPQILALAQPAPSSNTSLVSSPANVSQSRYQGNVAQHSPVVIDLTSDEPIISDETIILDEEPIILDEPSTSVALVSQPSTSNIDQPIPPPPTFMVPQDSTSNVNQASSNAVKSPPLLLDQLSDSMVSLYFTSLFDQPFSSASKDNSGPLEINQPYASEVAQPAASVVVTPSSEIDQPLTVELNFAQSTLGVDQKSTSELDQSSTLNLNESFPSEVGQQSSNDIIEPSSFEVEQISTFEKSKVEQKPVAEVEQHLTSEVKRPPTSEVKEKSTFKNEPSTSKVDQPSTSGVELPTDSKVKQSFTSKYDHSDSSDDYSPPKKTKVAKRISKPRKSKYRAELLFKTYISDNSDDD